MKQINFFDIFRSLASWKIKRIKALDHLFGNAVGFFLLSKKRADLGKDRVKSILIIRPGGMGDAVLLLPILKELRKEFFEARIDVLCEKRNAQVFHLQRDSVDNIYTLESPGFFKWMMGEKYDAVVDSEQWHLLSGIIAYFKSRNYSIGFNTRKIRKKFYNTLIEYGEDEYELENMKKLFQPVYEKAQDISTIDGALQLRDEAKDWACRHVSENAVTIFFGGSIPVKTLNCEQSCQLIRKIEIKERLPVLVGGKEELAQAQQIMTMLSESNVQNFVGQTSLEQTAALVWRSRLFVGTDSGLLHLAAAVGTPTIGMFGPSNRKKWAPKGAGHKIFCHDVPCAPCAHFGYTLPTCQRQYMCMKYMKSEDIVV